MEGTFEWDGCLQLPLSEYHGQIAHLLFPFSLGFVSGGPEERSGSSMHNA